MRSLWINCDGDCDHCEKYIYAIYIHYFCKTATVMPTQSNKVMNNLFKGNAITKHVKTNDHFLFQRKIMVKYLKIYWQNLNILFFRPRGHKTKTTSLVEVSLLHYIFLIKTWDLNTKVIMSLSVFYCPAARFSVHIKFRFFTQNMF